MNKPQPEASICYKPNHHDYHHGDMRLERVTAVVVLMAILVRTLIAFMMVVFTVMVTMTQS